MNPYEQRHAERLARVKSSAKSDRDEIRDRLKSHPDLLFLVERAWELGGGLTWLRVPGYERGKDLPHGIIPAERYEGPQGRKRKGKTSEEPGEVPEDLA